LTGILVLQERAMKVNRRELLRDVAIGSLLIPTISSPAGAADTGAIEEKKCTLLGTHVLPEGKQAVQGLAVGAKHCFAATNGGGHGLVHRFTHDWKYVSSTSIQVEGVDHLGAISHHRGSIWGGWLTSTGPRKSMVTELRARDLKIVRQFDITSDVTWIDPVCFDGTHVWVGDLSDLGIHRYKIKGDKLVRDAIFRYPGAMHFSQGLVIRDKRLYTIHTFGEMDGLFEFDLKQLATGKENRPQRSWPIAESTMHLEGFDFVPGTRDQVWHSQGQQVDRWQLDGLA
jgi:hypothetical protein